MRPRLLSCWCVATVLGLCTCGLLPVLAQEDEPLAKPSEQPEIAVLFHKGGNVALAPPEATMRFGIVLPKLDDPQNKMTRKKQLTWHPLGVTSNVCIRLDGQERLLGSAPGKWTQREGKLGNDAQGKPRLGLESIWSCGDEKVQVTQTVETVRGEQTGKVDTCRVEYLIENKDEEDHTVGLRFLLDTFIGSNDGAPFIVPGQNKLCDTQMDFKQADKVPAFAHALERLNLKNPGVVAHLKLKLGGGLEPPSRVSFGAWPDPDSKVPAANGGGTLWNVPVFSIKSINDAAAVIYWAEKKMTPGSKRKMGFTYGLGYMSSDESGQLALILYGTFKAGDDMTVLALVNDPKEGETITLKLAKGFEKVQGEEAQPVPPPPAGASSKISPVTWTVRTAREGIFPVTIESSSGVTHRQGVRINKGSEQTKETEKDKE